ncbi:MAG TPA: thiolase family protein [Roseiflexaceae bacterium]|nr:thiolase family protein [Roseiflexaceae bacterium]
MTGHVFLVDAVRTPTGRRAGGLAHIHPINLAAHVLRALVQRSRIEASAIDDVIMGCVTQTGDQGANIARLAVLQAGFPVRVPAFSLNRMCGSSQQAIHSAAQAILAGDADLVIAGGVESMSRVAMGSDWNDPVAPPDMPFDLPHQGISAEHVARNYQLSRVELDDYSYTSHIRAAAATHAGRFEREIVPLPEAPSLQHDEGIRFEPNRERMRQLAPAFVPDGVITAANSSQISDGAAAVLLASEAALERYGLQPRARVAWRVVVGSDPVVMLDGPIAATRRLLERSGLTLDDIDLFEVNEAFASVALAWQKTFGVPMEQLNVNGGAIALGHPLGASGARIMATLLNELERRNARRGLQTMCIGHGMATATILERT